MRLHTTTLMVSDITKALSAAQGKGLVASHIDFVQFTMHSSRSHARAFELQLGTDVKLPGDNRRYKNSGNNGASTVYAATYDEWGWFIKELFVLDPLAKFGHYETLADFNKQTDNKYV